MEKSSVIEIGEQVIIEREIREVTNLIHNIDNELVIVWKSKHGSGGCIPSLWHDWRNGHGVNY